MVSLIFYWWCISSIQHTETNKIKDILQFSIPCSEIAKKEKKKKTLGREIWGTLEDGLTGVGGGVDDSNGALTEPASSLSSNLGWDLRFLSTKKPARVADRKIRISLSGHISFFSLSISLTHSLFGLRQR